MNGGAIKYMVTLYEILCAGLVNASLRAVYDSNMQRIGMSPTNVYYPDTFTKNLSFQQMLHACNIVKRPVRLARYQSLGYMDVSWCSCTLTEVVSTFLATLVKSDCPNSHI